MKMTTSPLPEGGGFIRIVSQRTPLAVNTVFTLLAMTPAMLLLERMMAPLKRIIMPISQGLQGTKFMPRI